MFVRGAPAQPARPPRAPQPGRRARAASAAALPSPRLFFSMILSRTSTIPTTAAHPACSATKQRNQNESWLSHRNSHQRVNSVTAPSHKVSRSASVRAARQYRISTRRLAAEHAAASTSASRSAGASEDEPATHFRRQSSRRGDSPQLARSRAARARAADVRRQDAGVGPEGWHLRGRVCARARGGRRQLGGRDGGGREAGRAARPDPAARAARPRAGR